MTIPTGNGMFVWRVPACGFNGNVESLADLAKLSGVGHVLIKISDGNSDSNVVSGVDLARSMALALQKRGIEAWGWQFIYSSNPGAEAAKAVERVIETGVTGFIIDAEGYSKGKPAECDEYCRKLRAELPGMPMGLSSYRFPSLHPTLPWDVFRGYVDFDMPQVYWMLAHNPGEQLRRSFVEFNRFARKLPYVPTGAAFTEYGWAATKSDVIQFMDVCVELGIKAWNWWEWSFALITLPDLWPAIFHYEAPAPVIGDEIMVNTDTLNIRSSPMGDIIGYTLYNETWKVTGRVKDSYGREWVQSGPSAHMAGWLCRDV